MQQLVNRMHVGSQQYGSTNIEYYMKRSKGIRTSELIVDSDRIEVRTLLNKLVRGINTQSVFTLPH